MEKPKTADEQRKEKFNETANKAKHIGASALSGIDAALDENEAWLQTMREKGIQSSPNINR